MTPELLQSLKSLPVSERLLIVEELWDSIAETQEPFDLSDTQQAELHRRLDALENNQSPLTSWSDIKTRILSVR